MRRALLLVFAVGLLACLPGVSLAHSVYIFAWVDGTQICTESYFTRKSKVRGGEVLMADASGEILARGVTGEDGGLCFPLPDRPGALEFTVLAGAGHKGVFTLGEQDLAEAVRLKKQAADQAAPSAPSAQPAQFGPSVVSSHPPATVAASPAGEQALPLSTLDAEALIRRVVREELQSQLSPMRHYLAEKLEDTTPGVREIVGGVGWLAGLGALGFWFSQRRKKL